VLGEQGAEVVSTSELGAGAVLAQVPLDQVDFGIAVLPSGHEECAAGIPALYTARENLHPAVIEALRAGLRQAEIVHLSGYTREHVRKIARRLCSNPIGR
jgi:hypothetical protein